MCSWYTHDLVISSACLLKNGKIIFAISEERLNRKNNIKVFQDYSLKRALNMQK